MKMIKILALISLLSMYLVNCNDHHDHKEENHKHEKEAHEHHDEKHGHDEHEEHGHHHEPLHKAEGAGMKAIGDHFAHIEMVLKEDGKLILWLTDGGAEKSIRIHQKEIQIEVDGKTFSLNAVANSLTGESVGDTSQFEAIIAELKGKSGFEGKIKALTLKGKEFKDIQFHYPLDKDHKGH